MLVCMNCYHLKRVITSKNDATSRESPPPRKRLMRKNKVTTFFFFFMRILKLYSDKDKHNTSSAKERLVIHCISSIQVKKL